MTLLSNSISACCDRRRCCSLVQNIIGNVKQLESNSRYHLSSTAEASQNIFCNQSISQGFYTREQCLNNMVVPDSHTNLPSCRWQKRSAAHRLGCTSGRNSRRPHMFILTIT